jgi:hypothetical protein
MALILPINTTADVYRGFTATAPYPDGSVPPAVSGIGGHLKHHVRHGRFGSALDLHWTHAFYLPLNTDVRCGYNSQLNAWAPANADTLVVADYPIPGWCTAFLVVLVQKAKRNTPHECIVAYLDRMQPVQGSCIQVPAGVAVACCPSVTIPFTLHATVGTCDSSCYTPQTVTLTYDPVNLWWAGSVSFFNACRSYTETVTLQLLCLFSVPRSVYEFVLVYTCTLPPTGQSSTSWEWQFPPISSCSPLYLSFLIQSASANCCKAFDVSTYTIVITE